MKRDLRTVVAVLALAPAAAPAPAAKPSPGNQVAVAAGTAVELHLARPLSVEVVL